VRAFKTTIHGVLALLILGAAGLLVMRFWPHQPLPEGTKADRIVIDKSARKLSLLRGGKVLGSYHVSLGGAPLGHKVRQGDERTPEGRYRIDWRNPNSCCYRSLHISYPSTADRARAKKLGVPPGGDIMIHGLVNGQGWLGRWHLFWDWTNGCIAVTNREMREIWDAVPDGTVVDIRP
jgi:murein L,D-transpeptidase YafK